MKPSKPNKTSDLRLAKSITTSYIDNQKQNYANQTHQIVLATPRYLGEDYQQGRYVFLRYGRFGYFVASQEWTGYHWIYTYRTASLDLEGIHPAEITLDLAIRLLDRQDAIRLRKAVNQSQRHRNIWLSFNAKLN